MWAVSATSRVLRSSRRPRCSAIWVRRASSASSGARSASSRQSREGRRRTVPGAGRQLERVAGRIGCPRRLCHLRAPPRPHTAVSLGGEGVGSDISGDDDAEARFVAVGEKGDVRSRRVHFPGQDLCRVHEDGSCLPWSVSRANRFLRGFQGVFHCVG